jgi:hypothetical protein
VIALAILGIGLGVILPGIGLSLRLRQDASEGSRLAVAAEQVLGDLVLRKEAPQRAEEGEVDGCAWVIEPLDAAADGTGGDAARHGAELTAVRVTLSLAGGPRWEFTTLLPRPKPVVGP